MRLSRFHFDVAFLGGLLLLGAVVVRGWLAEDARPDAPGRGTSADGASRPPQPAARPRLARAAAAAREEAVDLLAEIDPKRDAVAGEWALRDGALVIPAGAWSRLQIPCVPPEEYDLDLEVARIDRKDALVLGIVFQGRQGQLALDANGGQRSWMEVKDGAHGITENGVTFFEGPVFAQKRPARLDVRVRRDRMDVLVDEYHVLAWRGPRERLLVRPNWEVPETDTLFVGAWQASYAITRLKILPRGGKVVLLK